MIGLFNAIVDLPIKMKGNSKRTSRNSLSPLGVQDEDISAALQTLLTEVELRLRSRLLKTLLKIKCLSSELDKFDSVVYILIIRKCRSQVLFSIK